MDNIVLLKVLNKFKRDILDAKDFKAVPGPQGPQGIQGPKGEKGDKGEPGVSVTGPKGEDGKDGKDGSDGVSVVSVEDTADGDLVFHFSNGDEQVVELGLLENRQGDTYVYQQHSGGSSAGEFKRTFTVGEDFTRGEIGYYNLAGQMMKTSSTNEGSTSPMLGLCLDDATTGSTATFLLMGFFDATGYMNGETLFVSPTAGEMTTNKPSSGGQFVRVVGYAISSEEIYFNPDATWVGLEA